MPTVRTTDGVTLCLTDEFNEALLDFCATPEAGHR
jgi:hypothetical protein